MAISVITAASQGGVPAFSAYMGSSQTLSQATPTKLQFNTKLFDTNSNFDATTNYRFTPTVAGYYQITGSATLQSTTTTQSITILLYKNGSSYKVGVASTPTGSAFAVSEVTSVVYFNGSTDYVEMWGYIDVGSGSGTVYAADSTRTQFCGAMVRST